MITAPTITPHAPTITRPTVSRLIVCGPKPSKFEDTLLAVRIICDYRSRNLAQVQLGIRKQSGEERPIRVQRSESARIVNGDSTTRFELPNNWIDGTEGVGSLGVLDLRAFGLTGDADVKMNGFEFNSNLFDGYQQLATAGLSEVGGGGKKTRFRLEFAPTAAAVGTQVGHSVRYTFDRKRFVPTEVSIVRHVEASGRKNVSIPIAKAHYEWHENDAGIMLPDSLFLSRRRIARDENNRPLAEYQAKQDLEFKWLSVNEPIDEKYFSRAYWKENKSAMTEALSDEFLRTE